MERRLTHMPTGFLDTHTVSGILGHPWVGSWMVGRWKLGHPRGAGRGAEAWKGEDAEAWTPTRSRKPQPLPPMWLISVTGLMVSVTRVPRPDAFAHDGVRSTLRHTGYPAYRSLVGVCPRPWVSKAVDGCVGVQGHTSLARHYAAAKISQNIDGTTDTQNGCA